MKKTFFRWLTAITFVWGAFNFYACGVEDSPAVPFDQPGKYATVTITDITELNYELLSIPNPLVRVNYTYYSVDTDGKTPLLLSAAITFDKKLFDRQTQVYVSAKTRKSYDAAGLALIPHFTMTSMYDAPTTTQNMQMEGPLLTIGASNDFNLIIVSPDFNGFGATIDKPQAYLMADISARQALDALDAAKRVLAKMNYTYAPFQALIGYSQGGHTAMSIQRWLARNKMPQIFDIVCAGGGPFDLEAMANDLLKEGAVTHYPCALPLMFVEANEAANLGLDYNQIFRAPLNSKLVGWFKSKKLTTENINDSICHYLNANITDGVKISDMVNIAYVNKDNIAMQKFFDYLDENTLVKNWTPRKDTKYFLYHTQIDEVVPFVCFENMCKMMKDAGLSDNMETLVTTSSKHAESAAFFVLSLFPKLFEEAD